MALDMPSLSPASHLQTCWMAAGFAGPAWLQSLLPGLQDGWLWTAWLLEAAQPLSSSTGEESEPAVFLLQTVVSRPLLRNGNALQQGSALGLFPVLPSQELLSQP